MENEKIKKFSISVILISLGTFLSLIKIPLPFGGGITAVSMLPVILISYCYGVPWGFFSSLIYAFVQMVLGISTISRYVLPGRSSQNLLLIVIMCVFDYLFAYVSLSCGGMFRRERSMKKALVYGTLISLLLKYLFHVISGAILCNAWLSVSDISVFAWMKRYISGYLFSIVYSIVFNGLYMIPEILITMFFAVSISKVLTRYKFICVPNMSLSDDRCG